MRLANPNLVQGFNAGVGPVSFLTPAPTLRRMGILQNVARIWEVAMTVYMVERDLKGISMDALGQAQKAAIAKAQAMTSAGTDVRYIRSTFAPGDGRCMCLFEAKSAEDVKRLNDDCGLPYSKVVEALDLTPPAA